jgi:putative transposase
VKKVGNTGAVEFRGIRFGIGRVLAGRRVHVMDPARSVTISDLRATLIIEHPWPGH